MTCEAAANDSTLRCKVLRSLLDSQDPILALTVLYLVLTVLYLVLTVLHLILTVLHLVLTVLYAPHSLGSGTPERGVNNLWRRRRA